MARLHSKKNSRFAPENMVLGSWWVLGGQASFQGATVDGRNPAPVEVGSSSHYLQGFIHPRWCRISSINRMLVWGKGIFFFSCSFFLEKPTWHNLNIHPEKRVETGTGFAPVWKDWWNTKQQHQTQHSRRMSMEFVWICWLMFFWKYSSIGTIWDSALSSAQWQAKVFKDPLNMKYSWCLAPWVGGSNPRYFHLCPFTTITWNPRHGGFGFSTWAIFRLQIWLFTFPALGPPLNPSSGIADVHFGAWTCWCFRATTTQSGAHSA